MKIAIGRSATFLLGLALASSGSVWAAGRRSSGQALASAANTLAQMNFNNQQQSSELQNQMTLMYLDYLLRRKAEEERFQREMNAPQEVIPPGPSTTSESGLMFCPTGGERYPRGVRYCPKHGTELKKVSSQ